MNSLLTQVPGYPSLKPVTFLFHETMVLTLAERHDGNAPILDRLNDAYAVTLLGLLIELVGLGLAAALAS